MNRALHARLRHHSLTCFSRIAAITSTLRSSASPATASIYKLRNPRSTCAPLAISTSARAFSVSHAAAFHSSIMNGTNGTPRAKRKQHPGQVDERPQKQHRALNGKESAGDNTPEVGSAFEDELDIEEPRLLAAMADTAEWQAAIENVVKNVVSIRFCQTCSFDTDSALTSEATGFVVDAERGYIMTNRHVVGSGPFWGYCIFDNHEEVDAYPVYRDPVHDFGILRFDPQKIKYMPVSALPLRPDLAKVGSEIRVVGNDAGEKLSILSGVISRLDRNAPEYGDGYCDFNTNYIQAAAAASGGSSGSPVVNIDGFAVALQAGGRSDGAATDYFLPLDRPLRALKCIQDGKPITRGTIQCQWMIKPFDECRRLGLTPEWESAVRKNFPKETGMLVAEIVLPHGPSDNKIEEGDVLIKVNGELLTQFVRLDDILDSSVDRKVSLVVQRGGEDIEVEVKVEDLHAITPDRFVSVAGASFHDLSYQQARLYAVACKGVFVCEATGSFRFEGTDNGWIIQTLDHKPTPDLDAFIKVAKGIPDRSRVVVTYKHLRDLHTLNTSIIHIDRHWSSKMRLAVRNDTTGLWDFTDLADAIPAVAPVKRSATFIQLENAQHPAAAEIVRSFVRVLCHMPVKLDGFPRNRKWGMGVVIDAEKGLVVISRAIVPYDLCDISITIADSIIVEGKVVFLHPLQNYAIIQYDPSLVDAPVQSAKLSKTHITQGASTYFVGFNQNMRVVIAQTTVTDITAVAIPANSGAPRYRAVNVDAITVDTSLSGQCGSGVLVAEDGTVQALWLTYLGERSPVTQKDTDYHLGLATPTLLPVINKIQRGEQPKLRMLSVEFTAIQMSQARIMGVTEEWIKKVAEDNSSRHQLFMIRKRTFERGDQAGALMEGDVILSLNGKIITRVQELDVMYDHEVLDAVIVRDCEEMSLKIPTVSADDLETDRAVSFCGAILHRPHHAVRQQISKLHSEVYVSARTRGSPAYQYGLAPTNFITHVNGKLTPDLEAFLKAVVDIPDNTYFRLKAMTFDNVPWVITMKKNDHYFPTTEWIKDPAESSGWRRVTYEQGKKVDGEGSEGINLLAGGGDVDGVDE
ncbi:Pro-apoptotic serine protease, partial [Lachnellula suecica]